MGDTISVILAEDSDVFRHMLTESLLTCPDITVIGEAVSGEELIDLCRETPPDVAVIDIRMPGMGGVEAAKILRAEMPDIRLLILTTFDDDEYLRALFGLGIDGYLLKNDNTLMLADAVRSVYRGIGAVDANISRKLGGLLNPVSPVADRRGEQGALTDMERRAAELIAQGKYNKDIAIVLGITYGRARNLVSKVYARLGAVDREDLVGKLKRLMQEER